MSELINRRISPRIPCDLSVHYGTRGARVQPGRITDIGTAGARLAMMAAVPPIGTELLLRFHLPISSRPVQTLGSVRWTKQGIAGVEFVYLSPQAQDEIWRYYAQESARRRGTEIRPRESPDPTRDLEEFRARILDAWRQFIRESEQPPS